MQVLQRDVAAVEVLARDDQVGPLLERVAKRPLEVDLLAEVGRRTVRRVERRAPDRVGRAAHDEALERHLGQPAVGHRRHQRLLPRGRLGLRGHDVERRQGTDLDADLVVVDQLLGQVHRHARRVDRLHGVDEVPVGVLGVGDGVDDQRADGRIRVLERDEAGGKRLPVAVDHEVLDEWLRHRQLHRALVGRVEDRVVARCVVARVGPRHRGRAARELQRLGEPGRPGIGAALDAGREARAAAQLGGRLRPVEVVAKARRQRRAVEPARLRVGQVLDLGVQPPHHQVDVRVESAFHGLVESEIRRRDRCGWLPGSRRRIRLALRLDLGPGLREQFGHSRFGHDLGPRLAGDGRHDSCRDAHGSNRTGQRLH